MRLRKYLLLVVIVFLHILFLTACQSTSSTTSTPTIPMGRYIERDFDDLSTLVTADNFYTMFTDYNGLPLIYCQDNTTLKCFTFNRNHQLSQLNIPWIDAYNRWISETQVNPSLFPPNKDGEVYFIHYPKEHVIKISRLVGQSIEDVPIAWEKAPHHLLAETLTNQHTLLFLSEEGILSQYDGSTGKFINKYSDSTFTTFTTYEDTAICVCNKDKKLIFLDLNTLSVVRDLPLPSVTFHSFLQVDPVTGELYFLNSQGIWHLSQNSTVWEQIVDGNLCSLSSVALSCMNFMVYNNEFIINYLTTNPIDYTFKILSYSNATPTHPNKEITVYSLYGDVCPPNTNSYGPYTYPLEKYFLLDALNQYQLSHPDVYFKYVTGINESTTREQAIQTLNTELLSGKGPDILIMDELPAQSYAKQNILLDLNDCIKPFFESNQILTGISTAYQSKGQIYTTPLRFALTTIWGKDSILQKTHSLHDLALYRRLHPEDSLYQYEDPEYLIWPFYPILSSNNTDSWQPLNKAVLKTFLEDIKTLSYNGEDYEIRSAHYYQDASALLVNHCKVHATLTFDMTCLNYSAYANKHFANYSYKLFPDNSHSAFEGLTLFSINANSPYQDTCKDLLQNLLSEDYQDHIFSDGFPVNKSSLRKLLYGEFTKNLRQPYTFLVNYGAKENALKDATANWNDYLDIYQNIYSSCEKLCSPSNMDSSILDIIIIDSKPYFNGSATLDSVTDKVYNKLVLYSKNH